MDPTEQMRRLVTGYRVSQAIYVAATLRLSDLLADGPMDIAALADATQCQPDTLRRLLRALASIGIYQELPEGRFAGTALSDQLRSGDPSNSYALAAFVGRPAQWQAWSGLLDSVRTGDNAFVAVHGQSTWAHKAQNPEEGTMFDAVMTSMSRQAADSIVPAYDFSRFGTLVDVAGGRGALLAAILGQHRELQGVLFDQPQVVAGAEVIMKAAGVEDRCRLVGGDMFVEVPAGGDGYIMKAILHDWEDPEAIAILGNCRGAMAESSTLLIMERLLDDADPQVTFGDINMLVGPGGRERTTAEFTDLLARGGFQYTRTITTASNWAITEAVPAA